MAEKRKPDEEWKSWALIVALFVFGLSPIALILLLIKLFGKDEEEAAPKKAPVKTAARKAMRKPKLKKSNSLWLKIAGGILMAIGLLAISEPISALFWSSDWLGLWLEDFITALAFTLSGGAMLFSGVSMDRQMKRFGRYLSIMGDREAIAVEELARKLGYPEKQVRRDLEKMVDRGYFGGRAYVNMELGYLFRSGEADIRMAREREETRNCRKAAEKQAAEGEYDRILREIRRANDEIADPVLSVKIQRLEDISAAIFRLVEAEPAKRRRIDTFLNYYLPTTQKLLDSYARFESAGVEGENLRQAKARIEKTMDSIVAGFEHQLDQLYKEDALDVDSDIRVMETMLRRDTASVERDFGLGGAVAVQQEEE